VAIIAKGLLVYNSEYFKMNTVLAVSLCALFSTTYGLNDTDIVYEFVNCSIRATAHGIDGLIPSHNPLWINDINTTLDLLGYKLHVEFTNQFVYKLMDVELRKVNVTSYTNPGIMAIDYDLYWPLLNLTGNFLVSLNGSSNSSIPAKTNGTYNVLIRHTDFFGLFNLTKPGQESKGIFTHVNTLTLNVTAKEVKADIKTNKSESAVNLLIETALSSILNNVPADVGNFLKDDRFNDFWIAHPERIKTITDWCAKNP